MNKMINQKIQIKKLLINLCKYLIQIIKFQNQKNKKFLGYKYYIKVNNYQIVHYKN